MERKIDKANDYLFVDGYNIINSWEGLRSLNAMELEMARVELLEIMAEYQELSGIKVIVVFDAHFVKANNGERFFYKGVEGVFTRENETADHFIERKLDEIGREKRVRVATSDRMEQEIVLGRGGTRISARELELEFESYKRDINRRKERKKEKDQLIMGKLDETILDKLKRWGK